MGNTYFIYNMDSAEQHADLGLQDLIDQVDAAFREENMDRASLRDMIMTRLAALKFRVDNLTNSNQALQSANQTLRLQVAALRQEYQHLPGAPFPPVQQDGDGDQDEGGDGPGEQPFAMTL